MKRIFIILAAIFLLTACGETEEEKQVEEKEGSKVESEESENIQEIRDRDSEQTAETEIDTSMYEYAKNVQVTDAIDINNYVSLIIEMNDELTPGMAFQHATNQTYDFLLQDTIQEAEKVGINILLNEQKIAMYEITRNDFVENNDKPMAQLVLDAATVQLMVPEVEQHAEIMELEYKRQ